MPARVTNIAPCITQVTFKLVHYALLINQLRFGLTFFKVLANFPTDKFYFCFCLFVYEHYNMIIVLGDPQLAKLLWAGHLS